tara:strand:+ start:1462 stop:2436 length:975 start_codon:yes stop_codon:yes gene_type:complete
LGGGGLRQQLEVKVKMRRREFIEYTANGFGALAVQQHAWSALREEPELSIVNGAEHAWVLDNPRFPMNARYSNCPNSRPQRNYSRQHLLAEMKVHGVDKVVISQVCYYGTDNSYTIHCVRTDPERFSGIGLLVGSGLYRPDDPLNPMRLESLMEAGLAGLRLSPIYDPETTWLNDPVSYPLWEKAQDLGAVFNIFLKPHQLGQVADMARRFPGVKVVIDHFAMIDLGRPDEEGIDLILGLQPLSNVYIRTSLHNPSRQGLPFRDMWPYLRRVYDVFGPRRMIYANFYELLIIKDLIPFFSAEDKAWILGKTAREAYSLSGTARR